MRQRDPRHKTSHMIEKQDGEGINELDLGSLPGIEKGPASLQPPTPT